MALTIPTLGDNLPVVITELLPPGRVITLAGRDRPEQPVGRATRLHTVQSWYPGATEASTQVLGVREEPLQLRGWFRDPLTLLDGGPQARIAILRGMQQGQALLNLVWGDNIILFGRLGRLFFETYRQHVVRYEIDFEIDKSMETAAPAGVTGVASTGAQVADTLDNLAAVFETAANVVRAGSALGAFVPEE